MSEAPPALSDGRFRRLYEEHRLAVFAYCARRLGADAAADACSDTFLAVWRKLDQVPTAPDTLPYLYGVARNVIRNQRRSRLRRLRLAAKLAGWAPAVPADDPSAVIVRKESDLVVQAAVRQLRDKDREIVMLYAWEDLSRATIAEMMGMSRAAIDQRLHRAYRQLSQILQPTVANRRTLPSVIAKGEGT